MDKELELKDWPRGWLQLECASILNKHEFILMHDEEKRQHGFPASTDEMRAFVAKHRGIQLIP